MEYILPGIVSELKVEKLTKKLRCKTCGTLFDVPITKKVIAVKCHQCGAKGKIKFD